MNNLFAYGTLIIPDISEIIIGISSDVKAVLDNYKVYCIHKNNDILMYPAIKKMPGSQAEGVLFENLSDKQIKALDEYEGDQYKRVMVNVRVNEASYNAWLYEWIFPKGFKLQGTWDIGYFKKNQLKDFLNSDEF